MKTTLKISTLVLAAVFMSFAPASIKVPVTGTEIPASVKTSIKWKNTEIQLGEIPQNKPVTIEFEFMNDGGSPLLITNVQASCGCTSTNFVKTPVLPGESTKITAVFNAAAKGAFHKQVTVTTNAEDGPKSLSFAGTVI
ncbi:hypothetical protein CNR22_05455 [Sphingobacteriaceae bacterium]|nr:hypothetical protein CNR22_05455 [Sphingobacteriaceae bacterium]